MRPLERDVVRKFTSGVEALGLQPLKVDVSRNAGWPDWTVPLPKWRQCWVELKRPGEEPTTLQLERIARLRSLGHEADWFDDAGRAVEFVRRAMRRAMCERSVLR